MDNFIIGTFRENINLLFNNLHVINDSIPKKLSHLTDLAGRWTVNDTGDIIPVIPGAVGIGTLDNPIKDCFVSENSLHIVKKLSNNQTVSINFGVSEDNSLQVTQETSTQDQTGDNPPVVQSNPLTVPYKKQLAFFEDTNNILINSNKSVENTTSDNTIIINATDVSIAANTQGFYIAPVTQYSESNLNLLNGNDNDNDNVRPMYYNPSTKEVLSSGGSGHFTDLNVSGIIKGPAELVIDPYPVDDVAGTVRIKGNLIVDGNINTEEEDPVFVLHVASGITSTLIGQWNSAYGWGNHTTQGYITSYTDTTYTNGTGISISATNVITNDAPDETVILTGTGATTTSGTYPNFTINSTDTNTTYTNGTGVTISASNAISIGQIVGVNDSPTFANLTLGNGGAGTGVINLRSFTANGTDTVAQMKSAVDGTDGGSLEFNTKLVNGALIKRMAIKNDGVQIYTDTASLAILTQDKTSQQGYIYNSTSGTKDFSIDSYSAITNKGIKFITQGVQRMRIGHNGEIGFGANNDTGSSNEVLLSGGGASSPYWGPAPASSLPQNPSFNSVSTQAIYGTAPNVYMTMNASRGGYGRCLIGTGYAGFQQEHYVNEFNCYYNGSGTGLYLNWHGGGVYYSGNNQLSDDRVKFNETNITNGLEVIRKLSPEKYTKRMPTEKIGTEEAGFIAQEVMAIPELKFAVKHPDKELIPGDPNTRYYAVAYESIFTYAVAGLKELDTIVQKQAQLISSLEARIKTLESK
tara:strand:+ start:2249 stop:4501 length:2253 start_codon:yes stop_codon:yes gene_type:complete